MQAHQRTTCGERHLPARTFPDSIGMLSFIRCIRPPHRGSVAVTLRLLPCARSDSEDALGRSKLWRSQSGGGQLHSKYVRSLDGVLAWGADSVGRYVAMAV